MTTPVEGYAVAATAEGYPEEWDSTSLWSALRTLYPVAGIPLRRSGVTDAERGILSTEQFWVTELQTDAQ
jgi:hypothetical protein